MTAAGVAWLVELVDALALDSTTTTTDDDDAERPIDRVLAAGLGLDPAEFAAIDPEALRTAIDALAAARSATSSEIVALHRQRLDVDRTVKAITAYVRALT